MTKGDILFTETQRFTQWYMWLLLGAVNLLLIYLLYRSFSLGKTNGQRFAAVILGVSTVVVMAITALMFLIRLESQITGKGIQVKFYPMDSEPRFYPWDSIKSASVRHYDPTAECHGWGIKATADNRALNISSDVGLQLVLSNNQRLLIGTQKPDELMIALNKAGR
jgi:hypothetical protein